MDGLPPAVNPSGLRLLRTSSVQLDRCNPAWGPLTDSRTNPITGKIDFRIGRQLRTYKKADPVPSRVKLVPITIVIQCLVHTFATPVLSHRQVLANIMICLGFYFCLHPGEYTGTTSDDHPCLLDDVVFHLHHRRLVNVTASDAEIEAATSVFLTFTE